MGVFASSYEGRFQIKLIEKNSPNKKGSTVSRGVRRV